MRRRSLHVMIGKEPPLPISFCFFSGAAEGWVRNAMRFLCRAAEKTKRGAGTLFDYKQATPSGVWDTGSSSRNTHPAWPIMWMKARSKDRRLVIVRPVLRLAIALYCLLIVIQATAANPPTRDPRTPGYVTATELSDGVNPPVDTNGNFILGPTHPSAPEMAVRTNVPHGTVYEFTMNSADSRIYPGIARGPGPPGFPDPANPARLIVSNSHAAIYTRHVTAYVPQQYVAGDAAPFIVGADGPDRMLFTALDNLVAEKKVPVLVAISIGNGGGDAQGSERGLEYDTMSGRYAEFVEQEVLPLVVNKCHVTLTRDPDGRATMGGSSGGSCALSMAWYHPELYHRVLAYSGTFVNQQWPTDPVTPHGAWEYHENLIPNNPAKPLRLWLEVGDRDLLNPNAMRDGMHDWVLANERMAQALAAKGYHYQFIFARNAGHTDRNVKQQTLPEALEWLWRDYGQKSK
jgi:iron(III)-enterobactin esterase